MQPRHGEFEHDIRRAMVEFVWQTDSAGRLTYISDAATRIFGVPAPRLLGRVLTEVMPPLSSMADSPDAAWQAYADGRSFRFLHVEATAERGERQALALSGVAYFDPDGGFAGHRGGAVSIDPRTRRILSQQETVDAPPPRTEPAPANLAAKDGDAAWACVRDAVRDLMHELRTPLNAAAGYVDFANLSLGSGKDADVSTYVQRASHALSHVLALIDQQAFEESVQRAAARNSQKPDADIATPLPAAQPAARDGAVCDLAEAISAARLMVEFKAARRRIDIGSVHTPERTVPVRGERKQVTQILVNLLDNAVKYTPAGGSVGLVVRQSGSKTVLVDVWDSGPGIPPEDRERIFERGKRLPQDTVADRADGRGLGLAIARRLARGIGGDLAYGGDAPAGQGACFRITLQGAGDRAMDTVAGRNGELTEPVPNGR